MKYVYADHAATTPLDREVYTVMHPYFFEYGNPSSMHAWGRRAQYALEQARIRLAKSVTALPEEILFTGSGTESDNFALFGTAHKYREYGTHIIVSSIEHKAVLESAHKLEREGFSVSYAPVNMYGEIDIDAVCKLVRDDTILISIMLGNNEIGTIQPVKELVTRIRTLKNKVGLPFIHTDACQVIGHRKVDVVDLGIDLLTFNSSKVYGPKGVGALYVRKGVLLESHIVGGMQERGLRAGTESVALAVGMAYAVEKVCKDEEAESERLRILRKNFITLLIRDIPDIVINGHVEKVLPHIVHVTVPKIEGESMVLMLDQVGIGAATGSACSAHDLAPSHVLRAIGQDADLIHGSVRFSFGRSTTQEDIEYIATEFARIVSTLKQLSALTITKRVYAKHR